MRMLLVLWSAESEGRLKLHGLDPRLSAGLEIAEGHVGDGHGTIASRMRAEEPRCGHGFGGLLVPAVFHRFQIGAGLGFIDGGQHELELAFLSDARGQHFGGFAGRGIVVIAEQPTLDLKGRDAMERLVHAIHVVIRAALGANLDVPAELAGSQAEDEPSSDFALELLRAMNFTVHTNGEIRRVSLPVGNGAQRQHQGQEHSQDPCQSEPEHNGQL
jgi:hypothetical protein